MRICVIHGPNLNLLGRRKKGIYGETSLDDINKEMKKHAQKRGIEIEIFQSNSEGEIIDKIHSLSEYHGIIMNPGALSHYSYSLRDAIEAVDIRVVEVHISNIFSREEFRTCSVTAPVCHGFLCGFGWKVYLYALDIFHQILS